MSEMQSTVTAPGEQVGGSGLSILSILIIFAKRKKLLLGLPFVAACAAASITLVLPNIYSASTTLLPPQQAQSSAGAILSQLGGAASLAGGLTGLKNPNDLYVGMLRSRTVADRLVERFELKKVYDTDSQEKARKALAGDTAIGSGKDGIISITVEGKDQKLVASVANAYVAELVQLTKVLAVTEAARRRMFYEHQLETAKNQLGTAEMNLNAGLESGGVVSVDSDSRAIVETVGRLRAQVSAKEIQLGSMQAFVTASNPEYRRVQEELSSLRAELARLENGRGATLPKAGGADGKRPGLENVKILRDVKYYQMLYELLAKQYEVARLDESKDNSMIQVLDTAVQPERKIKPGRAVIVVVTAVFFFFLACGIALLAEVKAALLQSPGYAAQWTRLKSYLCFR
jgi:tyrosine-protein kinase Etk/Wzc